MSKLYRIPVNAARKAGDKASVTVIKEGLKTPTAVEPGDTIWISERGADKAGFLCRND
jgi:hypothetical protein